MNLIDNENYSLFLGFHKDYYKDGNDWKYRIKKDKFYTRTRTKYPEMFYNLEVWWLWFVFKIKFS